MQIRNPRTGQFDYEINPLGSQEVSAVAAKHRAAQKNWHAMGFGGRAKVLLKLAKSIELHAEEISNALASDTGRKKISKIEVAGVIGQINRWIMTAEKITSAAIYKNRPTQNPSILVSNELIPYSLVGVISPWNFPLTLALIDAFPALMAGSSVIVKPSEVTPRFIKQLQMAIYEVAELEGVLLIIEGDGETGQALINEIDYLAFTGSVATGLKVAENCAKRLIPASLELGGKDPMIIDESANPRSAAQIALRASIVNTGQACQSIERVYIHNSILPYFLNELIELANKVSLNYPDISKGDIGPFIFDKQAEIVQRQIDEAITKGAVCVTGGKIENLGGGLYLRPTILTNVNNDMLIMQEETFGPVMPIIGFEKIEDAIQMANSSKFGLSAAVLADSIDKARSIAAKLNAGAISLNDGALTSMVWEAEKSSFGLSGTGLSRMGESGILRFYRRKVFISQTKFALPLSAYSEEN